MHIFIVLWRHYFLFYEDLICKWKSVQIVRNIALNGQDHLRPFLPLASYYMHRHTASNADNFLDFICNTFTWISGKCGTFSVRFYLFAFVLQYSVRKMRRNWLRGLGAISISNKQHFVFATANARNHENVFKTWLLPSVQPVSHQLKICSIMYGATFVLDVRFSAWRDMVSDSHLFGLTHIIKIIGSTGNSDDSRSHSTRYKHRTILSHRKQREAKTKRKIS